MTNKTKSGGFSINHKQIEKEHKPDVIMQQASGSRKGTAENSM
jgi:hypothetical protein